MSENRYNQILQLLSQAWMIYAVYVNGCNYDRFLAAIQEAQLAVFDEYDPGA